MKYSIKDWEVRMDEEVGGKNSKAALDALRLYGGDIRVRDKAGNLLSKQSEDDFYGDKDAYRTLNALLFDGIGNEYSRIEKEGKTLNTVFPEQIEETIRLYCRIFGLMCQRPGVDKREEVTAKRVERESTLEQLKKGCTVSFFSASKAGYQEEFAKKDGIILLEVHIPPDIPYLDFEQVLGKEYWSIEEREILLPPFVSIALQKESIKSAEQRQVRDKEKKPPKEKYRVDAVKFPGFAKEPEGYCRAMQMEKDILAEREVTVNAINDMNQKKWDQEFAKYCLWKRKLQDYLRYRFLEIYSHSVLET